MNLRQRILAAYLFILAATLAISLTILRLGNDVDAAADALLDKQLPELAIITDLQRAFVELERGMYEYYADFEPNPSANAPGLQLYQMSQSYAQIETTEALEALAALDPSNPVLPKLQQASQDIQQLSSELNRVLVELPFPDNWDAARAALEQASEIGRETVSPILSGELAQQVRAAAMQGGQTTQETAQLTTQVVLVSALFIVIIGAGIAFYVDRYMAETGERRRLAAFAERNPDAVLSVSSDGDVLYENPAAIHLLEQQTNKIRTRQLLPDDLGEYIARLVKADQATDTFEYDLDAGERALRLNCTISRIRDYDQYHIHLRNVTNRYRAQERLKFLAYHDDLTGVPNRRKLSLDIAKRDGQQRPQVMLLLLRPDRFQLVTSSFGYETGDLLITEIAERVKRIAAELLESPKLYRLEAAEFAILASFESPEDAQTNSAALSQRLLQGFDTPLEVNQANYVVSLSIGYVVRQSDTCDAVDMIRDSHAALIQAADGGGGASLRFTDALADRAMRAVQLEAALHGAIDRGELSVHYQPQVTANDTSLCGAEALVRWQSPEFGFVSPGEFIPLAESSGLIRKIGDWVAEQAFRQAAAWSSSESANIQVAINVSAQQLLDPTFPPRIQQLLNETGVPPALIELEITESAVMGNMRQAISAMNQLKAMGIDLAIDDFGTGYSSLSYLQDFPTDKLKIDQSFVRDLDTSSADQAIVITMITLGKNLGMRVLAEGVETEAQLDILKTLGCDEIQGYLTGKPRLAEETLLDFQDGRWKG